MRNINVQASKQATVDDDPTGIRYWINSDLVGLKHKMMNIKKQRPIQGRMILNCVLYLGWPNQPSSGAMGVNIARGVLYEVIVFFVFVFQNTISR